MVEVRKKEGESAESLVRRFNKRVQQSGVLLQAKRGRFFEPPKNKRKAREDAQRRSEIKEKKEILRKMGKLEEGFTQRGRQGSFRPLPRIK
ncbi:MAG: 30S ribosomal protein S21 [Patescibacteria group bacterium]